MYSDSFWSSIKSGVFFGLLYWLALCAFAPYEHFLSGQIGMPEEWGKLSHVSLLAAAVWGSFLVFNRRNPELPAHFPYHLLVGVAFAFTAAMLSSVDGYLYFIENPFELEQLWASARLDWALQGLDSADIHRRPESYAYAGPLNFAIAKYSNVFFLSFCFAMTLGTVSCIWECSEAEAQ